MKYFFVLIMLLSLTGCTTDQQILDSLTNIQNQELLPMHDVIDQVKDDVDVIKSKVEPVEVIIKPEEDVDLVPVNEPTVDDPEEFKLPATFDVEVPFISQSPTGDWGLPYQEACEEASLIMVSRYFNDQELTAEIMDEEIKLSVAWEEEPARNMNMDSNVEEIFAMSKNYFNLKGKIIDNPTVDQIKSELVAGNLIVAPFAGRELGNKFFSGKGPLYHMLVIRGYDRNEFITNDVGTRHGEAYKYKYEILMNAIHDLPVLANGEVLRPYENQELEDEAKADLMLTGAKRIMVFSK